MQEVELDKHIRLIDSPGVVLASKGQFDPVEVALKNAIRIESLNDPITPVLAILRRCSIKTVRIIFCRQMFVLANGPFQYPRVSRLRSFLIVGLPKVGSTQKRRATGFECRS